MLSAPAKESKRKKNKPPNVAREKHTSPHRATRTSYLTSSVDGAISIPANKRVCPCVEESLDNVEVASHCGERERGVRAARKNGVQVGAFSFDEPFHLRLRLTRDRSFQPFQHTATYSSTATATAVLLGWYLVGGRGVL